MKIIQIAVTQGELFALTEDGCVHRLNGGGDNVPIGYTWEALPQISGSPHVAQNGNNLNGDCLLDDQRES